MYKLVLNVGFQFDLDAKLHFKTNLNILAVKY